MKLKVGSKYNNNWVNFMSIDGKIHYSIPFNENDIFAFIKEKFYQIFPEYRENNNSFLTNGNTKNKSKNIEIDYNIKILKLIII